MNKKYILASVFIIFSVIQLAIPGYMVFKTFNNLEKGKDVRLECIIRDPYDFMKGRYVALNFAIGEADSSICPPMNIIENNMAVYCILEEKEGHHTIRKIVTDKPSKNDLFIKAKIRNRILNSKVMLSFDFDKYYLQEDYAQYADKMILSWDNIKKFNPILVLSVNSEGIGISKKLLVNSENGEIDIEEYIKIKLIK
jgi:uncharacterized membrane-anchored protein